MYGLGARPLFDKHRVAAHYGTLLFSELDFSLCQAYLKYEDGDFVVRKDPTQSAAALLSVWFGGRVLDRQLSSTTAGKAGDYATCVQLIHFLLPFFFFFLRLAVGSVGSGFPRVAGSGGLLCSARGSRLTMPLTAEALVNVGAQNLRRLVVLAGSQPSSGLILAKLWWCSPPSLLVELMKKLLCFFICLYFATDVNVLCFC